MYYVLICDYDLGKVQASAPGVKIIAHPNILLFLRCLKSMTCTQDLLFLRCLGCVGWVGCVGRVGWVGCVGGGALAGGEEA